MKRLATMALLFAACQKPNWNPDPPWPHVPITVAWTGIDRVFDSSIASALGAWNYAAHCDHRHRTSRVKEQPYHWIDSADSGPAGYEDGRGWFSPRHADAPRGDSAGLRLNRGRPRATRHASV